MPWRTEGTEASFACCARMILYVREQNGRRNKVEEFYKQDSGPGVDGQSGECARKKRNA